MKKQFLVIAVLLVALQTFSNTTPDQRKASASISFTENKGQVYDQHFKARKDVLYSAMAGNLSVHIKNSGVSYQLNRIDGYKDVVDERTKQTNRRVNQQTVYRVDLNWIGCNTNCSKMEDEALFGYNNYYLESCPQGALEVKSYKGVTLKNIYEGIDLITMKRMVN